MNLLRQYQSYRTMAAILAVASFVITVPASAARTDRARYRRHVGAFAIPQESVKGNRNRMCLCIDGYPETNNVPGYTFVVERTVFPNNVSVICAVPEFDDSGSLTEYVWCEELLPLRR